MIIVFKNCCHWFFMWFKTKMKMADLSLISLFCIDIVGYEIDEV